ncbi:sorting nexin-27 isoform X1 [Octopus sinensis]|uniref:Sorting nexin-27 isoform X1 n=2 Tax=Octopus sinensis TaxID=2607531 RepID=A0A6P7T0P0_9MOLL|nr:sorting nexin-27 isoform X1 [Octopus sinensis]
MADSDEEGSTPSTPERMMSDHSGPRVVTITKTETGFGFNVRGQVSEGGVLKSINGVLYAPLQHVSAVLEGGAAHRAGIRKGDRILEVNGVNVEGATHRQVVDLIKSGRDNLTLTVISVPERVAERLEPSDDSSGPSLIDYSERRSLPISIPDYQSVENNGEKYVVFNIYMAGRHLCSRRYREFDCLHSQLKREFTDFNFPKLPGKKLFTLSDQQLDARRRGLEQYLEKVCAVRVIGESETVQEFLAASDSHMENGGCNEVELKVSLPDHSLCVVTIRRTDNTEKVYQAVCNKLQIDNTSSKFFYLFETVDYNFERKLQPQEFPHNIYIQNYSTATATCIALRKWVFSLALEMQLSYSEYVSNLLYWQAIDDVSRSLIKAGDRLYELKALQEAAKVNEYLKMARRLDSYGEIVFPHCACDSRKEGHVMASIGIRAFRLQACKEDGSIEPQVVEIKWSDIKNYDIDDETMSFIFEYFRPSRKSRLVRIYSTYFVYMYDSFERIFEELDWQKEPFKCGLEMNQTSAESEDSDRVIDGH